MRLELVGSDARLDGRRRRHRDAFDDGIGLRAASRSLLDWCRRRILGVRLSELEELARVARLGSASSGCRGCCERRRRAHPGSHVRTTEPA